MEERLAEVNGRRVRWREAGEGPPVVFLPGEDGSAALWSQVVALLPAVFAIRLEHDGDEPDIGTAAAWLAGFGGEPAVVVAHGTGCALARALAAERPDLVGALVLTGSGRRRLLRRTRVGAPAGKPAVRAFVVWGDHDDLRLGRELADALDAEFDLVEDAGRRLPEEHPGRIAQTVGRASITPRAASAEPSAHRPARSRRRSAPRTRRAPRPG